MPESLTNTSLHLAGDAADQRLTVSEPMAVDTFGGKVFVRWDPDASVTGLGPVAYFIEFLKANGLWEKWVQDCPLHYRSPNAGAVTLRVRERNCRAEAEIGSRCACVRESTQATATACFTSCQTRNRLSRSRR